MEIDWDVLEKKISASVLPLIKMSYFDLGESFYKSQRFQEIQCKIYAAKTNVLRVCLNVSF